MAGGADGAGRMVLGGCRLPTETSEHHLTLSSARVARIEAALAAGRDPATGLLDEAAFEDKAGDALRQSAVHGTELSLTRSVYQVWS